MSEKEYIFVGNAQLKTRDYIKQLEKDNREKDKEIGKLVDELEEQERHIKEANAEIERLNNIINELEKWLKEEVEATVFDYHFAIEDVLDKLQELKGSDKE